MTIDKNFNAENATTVDTALTTSNLAIQGGANDQFTPSTTGGGSIKIRNAASAITGAPIHNLRSYQFDCPTTGDSAIATATESAAVTQKRQAVTMYHPAAPVTTDQTIISYQAASGACMSVVHRTTGRIAILNANAGTTVYVTPNDSTGILTYPCTVTYDSDLDVGTTGTANTGDGKAHLNIYKHSVSTSTPWNTAGTTAENNNYTRAGNVVSCKVGKTQTTGTMSFIMDSWRLKDGLGLQGTIESPTNTPPVATVGTPTHDILTGATTSFTGSATDAEGNTLTYLWANATRPAAAAAPTLSGSTTVTMTTSALTVPGVYTFTFKANDGTADSNVVTVTAYVAAADGSISVKARRSGGSYVGAVANLSDGSDTTVVTSPDAPAGAVEIWDMNPCKPGDAFTTVANALTLRMRKRAADGTSDTTATETVTVDILTGPTDTLVTASPRSFVLTNTITAYLVQLTAPESAAFTNHDIWAIRVTTTEG